MRVRRCRLKVPLHKAFPSQQAAEGYMRWVGAAGVFFQPPTLADMLWGSEGWLCFSYQSDIDKAKDDPNVLIVHQHPPGRLQ